MVAARAGQRPRRLRLDALDHDLVDPRHREGGGPAEAVAVAGGALGGTHLRRHGVQGTVVHRAVEVAEQDDPVHALVGDRLTEGVGAVVPLVGGEAGVQFDAYGRQVRHVDGDRALGCHHRGPHRARPAHPDVDGAAAAQRVLAPEPHRALHRAVLVRRAQRLLVRGNRRRLELLQRHDVRAGLHDLPRGSLGVGVLGVDVVRGDRQIAAGARLSDEQSAEEVGPDDGRQQQRDQRGGGAPYQRGHEKHGYEKSQPRQEGLHETAQVADAVGDLGVQDHQQRRQDGEHRDDDAPPPDAPVAAPAVGEGPDPALGRVVVVGAVHPGLSRVLLRHSAALTALPFTPATDPRR